MVFPKKLQTVLIAISIPVLVFISHCFALLHWEYTWVNKSRTSVSVMITGFIDLDACKTIRISASWSLQVKSIFAPDGVIS